MRRCAWLSTSVSCRIRPSEPLLTALWSALQGAGLWLAYRQPRLCKKISWVGVCVCGCPCVCVWISRICIFLSRPFWMTVSTLTYKFLKVNIYRLPSSSPVVLLLFLVSNTHTRSHAIVAKSWPRSLSCRQCHLLQVTERWIYFENIYFLNNFSYFILMNPNVLNEQCISCIISIDWSLWG